MSATLQEHQDRVRSLICCIATKAVTTADSMLLALSNKNCALTDLQLLVAFEDALSCYQPPKDEVLASGTISFSPAELGAGDTVNIFVNGVSITGGVLTYAHASASAFLTYVLATINSLGLYTATAVNGDITITALAGTGSTPNGYVISATVTGMTRPDEGIMAGGEDAIEDGDYCLTEDEVEAMFKFIQDKCGVCFTAYGDTQ